MRKSHSGIFDIRSPDQWLFIGCIFFLPMKICHLFEKCPILGNIDLDFHLCLILDECWEREGSQSDHLLSLILNERWERRQRSDHLSNNCLLWKPNIFFCFTWIHQGKCGKFWLYPRINLHNKPSCFIIFKNPAVVCWCKTSTNASFQCLHAHFINIRDWISYIQLGEELEKTWLSCVSNIFSCCK